MGIPGFVLSWKIKPEISGFRVEITGISVTMENLLPDLRNRLDSVRSLVNNKISSCLAGKIGFGPALQDKMGNLWFPGKMTRLGGDGGVWKYDGNTCKNLSIDAHRSDIILWCAAEDLAGNIWFGTNDNRLYRYDGWKGLHLFF